MASPENEFERNTGNFTFAFKFRDALKDVTSSVPSLRILDYGAGAHPYLFSFFSILHRDQQPVVAYDPSIRADVSYTEYNERAARWTGIRPEGFFHLVVCNFSIHHMERPPREIFEELVSSYNPQFLALAEYDYTKADVNEFANTFVNESEEKELRKLFAGNMQRCFDFHRNLGYEDFRSALEDNGFSLVQTAWGEGIAVHKFLMIGKRVSV